MRHLYVLAALCAALLAAPPAPAQIAQGQGKFIGNIVGNPNSIPSNFGTYWNQVTPENAGKWSLLEPTQGQWNWVPLQTVYNYAQSRGIPFRQHTFVWGAQEPSWVAGQSAGAQRGALTYFISEYFNRFPNTYMVDVVNEPLHQPPSYRNALGGNGATGWDWVIESFRIADQYNTGARLMINEYGIIGSTSAAYQYRAIIDLLNARGLIDGIGIQCHSFNMDTVSPSTMRQVLDILAATGLPIYVTELDMTGTDSQQLQRYQDKFPVFWQHPAVRGITLWGYQEGAMWQQGAHLIRSNGTERPALTWLRQYVQSNPGGGGGGGGGAATITVRARGTSGSESIRVLVGGQQIGQWTLTTGFRDYTATTNNTTDGILVEFTNDATGRDVQVDYLRANSSTRQAEAQTYNTGVYQNGACGGGNGMSEWLHCNGSIGFSPVGTARVATPTEPGADAPLATALHGGQPNPFAGSTLVAYDLAEPAQVRLDVYDVVGRAVATLADGTREAGEHVTRFEAGALPAGVYVVRLEAVGDDGRAVVRTRRVTLFR